MELWLRRCWLVWCYFLNCDKKLKDSLCKKGPRNRQSGRQLHQKGVRKKGAMMRHNSLILLSICDSFENSDTAKYQQFLNYLQTAGTNSYGTLKFATYGYSAFLLYLTSNSFFFHNFFPPHFERFNVV